MKITPRKKSQKSRYGACSREISRKTFEVLKFISGKTCSQSLVFKRDMIVADNEVTVKCLDEF